MAHDELSETGSLLKPVSNENSTAAHRLFHVYSNQPYA